MQNYPVGYAPQPQYNSQPIANQQPVQNASANGATFNIGTNTPGSIPVNGANGVTINIMGATVTPNGANVNNTYNTTGQPGQSYGKDYYTMPQQPMPPTVPVAATSVSEPKNDTDKKSGAKKDIVLLTDNYIRTLENYIRNDNPEIKLMGAKELANRFKEDSSRAEDPALTALLNLTLQSRHSNVKMVGMGILQNGWAKGDAMTQQLLSQIQQSNTNYGLDAIDAAKAALKTAGQTVKVDDPNPPKSKNK